MRGNGELLVKVYKILVSQNKNYFFNKTASRNGSDSQE